MYFLMEVISLCIIWLKQNNHITRKNKSTGSNIHYKIDDNINPPIYIPIFVKREKFTYDNKVEIPSCHKKWLNYCIQQLNTYSSIA